MSVWGGLENGTPGPDTSPAELAPTSQQQLQWPKWGQHYQSRGRTGEPCDLGAANDLLGLYDKWVEALAPGRRAAIWERMLAIHADQVFTIGIVAAIPQPAVIHERLRNVPERGVYKLGAGGPPRRPPHGHLLVRAGRAGAAGRGRSAGGGAAGGRGSGGVGSAGEDGPGPARTAPASRAGGASRTGGASRAAGPNGPAGAGTEARVVSP